MNEAYNHLSDQHKRKTYDEYRFGTLVPRSSYSIFNDFFNTRSFLEDADDKFFKPILARTPSQIERELDRAWGDWGWNSRRNNIFDEAWRNLDSVNPNTEYAESYSTSSFQQKGPEGITGKTVTKKSTLKDGKRQTIETEEVLKPDGSKEVTETVWDGRDSKVNRYQLGAGQDLKAIKH